MRVVRQKLVVVQKCTFYHSNINTNKFLILKENRILIKKMIWLNKIQKASSLNSKSKTHENPV